MERMEVTVEQAEKWVTVPRVAQVYGIPLQTLYTALRSGRLRYVQIGRGRRSVYLLEPVGVTAYVAAYRSRGRWGS